MIEYTERAPSAALAGIVRCVWTLEADAGALGPDPQSILPDGRSELIVHCGDSVERVHANGFVERQPAVLFAGQLTGQLQLRPTGRLAVVGIRFHPDAAATVMQQPQHDLVNLTIGVDALSTKLGRLLGEVPDQSKPLTAAARDVETRLECIVNQDAVDRRVRAAVETIYRRRGLVSVEKLAGAVGVTRRHLERRFNITVGLSPKRLARIVRLQHALRILRGLNVRQRGTQTAAMCGYADQAHFVRECHEIAGYTPEDHVLRRGALAGFFAA